ncbi:MAG: response regulator transcription factor [Anaerolineales bacterium]
MAASKILLIDDDITLLELLRDHLATAGYEPLSADESAKGLEMAENDKPDLIVLDVMMPGMDGWEVCEQLRRNSAVPIIMLTAKGEELDKLRGFHLGVDDYVTKPFSFAELTARVRAVLTRTGEPTGPSKLVTSEDLSIDFELRQVSSGIRSVDLTPTEYQLLEILARSPGRTVPSEYLLNEVWGPEYVGETGHVKHFIWSLRKKIELDPGDPKHILTERGYGYRFE